MPDSVLLPSTLRWLQELPVGDDDQQPVPDEFDRILVEAVGRALRATGYCALRDLHHEVHGGVVVLAGRVRTYHQKQLAQAAVQNLKRVRRIRNVIEVVNCR